MLIHGWSRENHMAELIKTPKVGVGVILIRGDKVLLGKRIGTHGAGTWNFPGGHLEFGETISECASREVREETGLEVSHFTYGPYTNDFFEAENKHYITVFVLGYSDEGKPKVMEPTKCEEWRWFKWHELPEPLFLPTQNLLKIDFSPFRWSGNRVEV